MVVLFDLDGVVLDTESQYTVLWNNIGKKYGDVGEIGRLSKGQTLTHILDTYFKGQTELQKHIIEELYEFEKNMSYAPIPGVMEFMKQLKAASVPMSTGIIPISRILSDMCLQVSRLHARNLIRNVS